MSERGVVRLWSDEEGWGVIDSPATPGGCWAHFSSVRVAGLGALSAGQEVDFEVEAAEQDGFHHRATAAWPAGQEPVPSTVVHDRTAAYRSRLALTFDADDGDGQQA